MFQFPGFAPLPQAEGYHAFSMMGCPIRKSTDRFVFANPRSLSQLITSFFASKSQGILHTPLITFFLFLYATPKDHTKEGMQLLLRIPRTCFFSDGFLPSLNRFSDFTIKRHLSVVTPLISQSKVALVSYSICQRT